MALWFLVLSPFFLPPILFTPLFDNNVIDCPNWPDTTGRQLLGGHFFLSFSTNRSFFLSFFWWIPWYSSLLLPWSAYADLLPSTGQCLLPCLSPLSLIYLLTADCALIIRTNKSAAIEERRGKAKRRKCTDENRCTRGNSSSECLVFWCAQCSITWKIWTVGGGGGGSGRYSLLFCFTLFCRIMGIGIKSPEMQGWLEDWAKMVHSPGRCTCWCWLLLMLQLPMMMMPLLLIACRTSSSAAYSFGPLSTADSGLLFFGCLKEGRNERWQRRFSSQFSAHANCVLVEMEKL